VRPNAAQNARATSFFIMASSFSGFPQPDLTFTACEDEPNLNSDGTCRT
jgi:hypothetical protein